MDSLHHPLEHGIEDLARLLRVTIGQQLHRSFEVGEEHCDLFTLALEGGLGSKDFFGEMLRGVSAGRVEPRRGGTHLNGLATREAEAGLGRQVGPALPATGTESRAT